MDNLLLASAIGQNMSVDMNKRNPYNKKMRRNTIENGNGYNGVHVKVRKGVVGPLQRPNDKNLVGSFEGRRGLSKSVDLTAPVNEVALVEFVRNVEPQSPITKRRK